MLCEFPGTALPWTPHLDGRVKPPEWVAWGAQEEGKGRWMCLTQRGPHLVFLLSQGLPGLRGAVGANGCS